MLVCVRACVYVCLEGSANRGANCIQFLSSVTFIVITFYVST